MNFKSSALHMAVAFIAMGNWAVLANRTHPLSEALMAGVIQGMMSALITLSLKRMIEALSIRLTGIAVLIIPPLLAVTGSAGFLSLIHSLAGTPEVLFTIAVPVSVTAVYSAAYSYVLWRVRHD
ncbi:MAG: hypothetical protein ACK5II_06175 [Paracoccus sp. (in: a-proteobacteria)]